MLRRDFEVPYVALFRKAIRLKGSGTLVVAGNTGDSTIPGAA